jgi:hypothetical protein
LQRVVAKQLRNRCGKKVLLHQQQALRHCHLSLIPAHEWLPSLLFQKPEPRSRPRVVAKVVVGLAVAKVERRL